MERLLKELPSGIRPQVQKIAKEKGISSPYKFKEYLDKSLKEIDAPGKAIPMNLLTQMLKKKSELAPISKAVNEAINKLKIRK